MNERPSESRYFRLELAADLVRLPPSRVRRYVQRGLIRPSRVEGRTVLFDEVALARLRRIRRLTEDVGLDVVGLEVALRLLDEIAALRAALRRQGADADGAVGGSRRE